MIEYGYTYRYSFRIGLLETIAVIFCAVICRYGESGTVSGRGMDAGDCTWGGMGTRWYMELELERLVGANGVYSGDLVDIAHAAHDSHSGGLSWSVACICALARAFALGRTDGAEPTPNGRGYAGACVRR